MPGQDRELWRALFQSLHICVQFEPTKKWLASTNGPLARLPSGIFSSRLNAWLQQSSYVLRPQLSAAGRHILKNLVRCAIPLNEPALDRSLMKLIAVPWKNRQPTDKVAGALAYLWSQREPHQALAYLELIAKPYAHPGGKIEQYYRTARDFCRTNS